MTFSSRYNDYFYPEEDNNTKLSIFRCIYPFQDDEHKVLIYAHNWSEAHAYAHYHKMIVAEKIDNNYIQNEQ
jgi:hypothetical protein